LTGLVIAPSYIFLTFFKMIFLVIVLGFLHGLFLLPVLLSLFGPGSCTRQVPHYTHPLPPPFEPNGRRDDFESRLLSQEKPETQSSPNLADSLSDKNSIDSKAASLFPGEGGGRGAEILRIPRPSTTVSLSTVIGRLLPHKPSSNFLLKSLRGPH
jgi:hypothetical protein